ncbi:MAG: UDP-N-acetylglucosamine 2-epimerase (non-hydrolyzing) [Bacteroidales bacterium]|nr:UDP-N-acetylglucosamine 2-epimerase (non-hydrolyzing) [Bacteroidales bacterium]
MKILSVVGARPNFMKIAPFIRAINFYNGQTGKDKKISHTLVHTGQHYDDRMSRTFFEELNIPDADINLGVGSGTHAEQVGQTMIAFEKVLWSEKPDWVVVVGDVNATLACSVTAKKEHINCCHIEAGLRSGDMSMPEEVNRLVTDRLSDLLLTPDVISGGNLRKEGTPEEKIRFVGNIMIDTLEANRHKAEELDLYDIFKKNSINDAYVKFKGTKIPPVASMTLHRPSNVDHQDVLVPLVQFLLTEICHDLPMVWAVHPRARKMLEQFGLWEKMFRNENLLLLEPLGYLEMLKLNMQSEIMLTDSGGLQEECTVLGTPCLTMRWNTERPVTLQEHGGASILVGNNIERIRKEYHHTRSTGRKPHRPEKWDGHTAERCLEEIIKG